MWNLMPSPLQQPPVPPPSSQSDGASVFSRDACSQDDTTVGTSSPASDPSLLPVPNSPTSQSTVPATPPQQQQQQQTLQYQTSPAAPQRKQKPLKPPLHPSPPNAKNNYTPSFLKRPRPAYTTNSSGRKIMASPGKHPTAPFDESSEEGSSQQSLLPVVSPDKQQQQKQREQQNRHFHRITVEEEGHRMVVLQEGDEEDDDGADETHSELAATAAASRDYWDSSGRQQIPMWELQRMKIKANKLKHQHALLGGSSSSSSRPSQQHAEFHTPFDFDPHAGFEVPFPPPPPFHRRHNQKSNSSGGRSVGSQDSWQTQSSRGSASHDSSGHSTVQSGQKQQKQQQQGNIWTKPRAARHFRADSDSTHSSSLADIADHQQSKDPEAPSLLRAQQKLRQSFFRPGRRRPTHTQHTVRINTEPAPSRIDKHPKQQQDGSNKKSSIEMFPVVKLSEISASRGSDDMTLKVPHEDETTTRDTSKEDETTTNATDEQDQEKTTEELGNQSAATPEPDFQLHDLCGEAASTDDIAWRNALYVLTDQPGLASVRVKIYLPDRYDDKEPGEDVDEYGDTDSERSDHEDDDDESPLIMERPPKQGRGAGSGLAPLHIACLGYEPPPTFMVRALLYACPRAVRWRDQGGRLPLHLVAASSANAQVLELLLQEWPAALYQLDNEGLTPLHLLLRNKCVPLTVHNVSVLLGLTLKSKNNQCRYGTLRQQQNGFLLQRRGQHLNMSLQEMRLYMEHRKRNPVTVFNPDYDETDEEWHSYPPDVQVSLRQLAKWRRKKDIEESKRLSLQGSDGDEGTQNDDHMQETNPAAIPNYSDLKLPIHMAVARGIVQVAPLDESDQFDDEEKDEEDDDQEIATQNLLFGHRKQATPAPSQTQIRTSVVDIYNVLRCIIAAFPEGLCVRDADGKTPLLHVMTMSDGLPTLDLIELLLGKRSGAFREIPALLSDIPLHSITTLPARYNQFLCPAMVASATTHQLPLHLAAEEFLTEASIVETIFKSYPAAADVQDHKGRTPLHLLFSNYRLFPADPRVVSLLLSDSAANTRDVEGNLPFDLLIAAARCLPKRLPASWEADEMARIYQKFFALSLRASFVDGKPPNSADFLRQLRLLPPWIRRQSCSVPFVQELIIEELSSPWCTALVVSEGILLVTILVLVRTEIKDYIEGDSVHLLIGDNPPVKGWYLSAIHTCVVARLLILFGRALLAAKVSQIYYLVILNGWFWIDLMAMIFSFISAQVFVGEMAEASILSIATGATGLLWLSLVGFCATWFFGMALILGSLSKIANQILWPLLAGVMALVAFAQMFYSLLWTECNSAIPTTPTCTKRDSYRVIYLLLMGEPLVDQDGTEETSNKAIVLLVGFLAVMFLLLLAMLVAVVVGALDTDTDDVAFRSFWEPKLAFVISSSDWCCNRRGKYSLRTQSSVDLETRLEQLWDLLVTSLFFATSSRAEKTWHLTCRNRSGLSWAVPMVAVVIVPLWIILGFASLGFLWPPQIRRMLFRPLGWESRRRSSATTAEYLRTQLADIKSELVRVKTMSYERSVQVEREIHEVRMLMAAALHEQD